MKSTDDEDEFSIKGLKEIYEEYSVGQEQQMDTTEGPKGAEGVEQPEEKGQTSGLMIKVKKSRETKGTKIDSTI